MVHIPVMFPFIPAIKTGANRKTIPPIIREILGMSRGNRVIPMNAITLPAG